MIFKMPQINLTYLYIFKYKHTARLTNITFLYIYI